MRIKLLILIVSLLTFTLACNFLTSQDRASEPTPVASSADCSPTIPDEKPKKGQYETIVEEFDIAVPSRNRIYGMIRRPDSEKYPDLCFPGVILVPGGINPGRLLALGRDARSLAEAGMVVVTFNAEGRVDSSPDDIQSEGAEDYNGHRHQDGLCALVKHTAALPYVIAENVGISTQSYGITMAAGCVARHPGVPVKYIVDGEGPPNSYVTTHEARTLDGDPTNDKHEVVYGILGHYSRERDPSAANQAFWDEREAESFIGDFRGYYLRLQAEWDHAQPPEKPAEVAIFHQPPTWWQNKHTGIIVNAAVDGGVPWVRVNLPQHGNPVNARYDVDQMPVFLPGYLADKPWAVLGILEMARIE